MVMRYYKLQHQESEHAQAEDDDFLIDFMLGRYAHSAERTYVIPRTPS